MFKDRLEQAMKDLNLTQAQLSKITGIGRSSISQYLSGKNVPAEKRKKEIATALGLAPDYFRQEAAVTWPLPIKDSVIPRLLPEEAAKIMGLSEKIVAAGLRDGVFPWGYAIHGSGEKWVYFINAKRFAEIEGITI